MAPKAAPSAGSEAAQHRAEWDNPSSRPAGSAGLDAPHGTVGPLGCQGTLLAQIQLSISQSPLITFRGATLQPFVPQSVHRSRVVLSQVQLLLLNFIWLVIAQFAKISLKSLSVLKGINSFFLFSVICLRSCRPCSG